MKIALINPPITSAERYGSDIGHIGGHQAPLGLCCVAAYLEKQGHDVIIVDGEAEKLDNRGVMRRIRDFGPRAVGITSTTVAFHRAKALASEIKSSDPGLPVIIGGPHVTANAASTLAFPCFDFGVLKEGEETAAELLTAIENGAPAENVRGIAFRRGADVVVTEPRVTIKNMDELPFPARHLLPDLKHYRPPMGCYLNTPVISMVTSRGCPYKCVFCDNGVFGRNVRGYSPEYVVSEIEDVVRRYGAKEISFLDDTFTVNHNRMDRIMALMHERRVNVKWTCMTRADRVTKPLLKKMKASGCWQVSIGAESGNENILELLKKGESLEDVRNAVTWCAELGIYVKGFFMVGSPGETAETIEQTINFALATPFSDVVVTIVTPVAGTELHETASRYGTMKNRDWQDQSYWKPVFVAWGLDADTLRRRQRDFYRRFYLRPGTLWKQIKKIRSLRTLRIYAITLANIVFFFFYRPDRPERTSMDDYYCPTVPAMPAAVADHEGLRV